MLVYLLAIAIILCGALVAEFFIRGNKKLFVVIIATIVLFSLLAFRGFEIGIDLNAALPFERGLAGYLYQFQEIHDVPFSALGQSHFSKDMGYVFLMKVISLISINPNYFVFVISFITLIPFVYLYAKESSNFLLSIFLFFSVGNYLILFSALRQSIAMALIIFAFLFLIKKRYLFYILFVALAATFHLSALVFIAVLPLSKIKLPGFFTVSIIFLYVFLLRVELLTLAIEILSRYGNYTIEYTGAYTYLFFLVITFVLFEFLVDKSHRHHRLYRNILIISVAIQLFSSVSFIAMRMNYYFITFIPLIIPEILNGALIKHKPKIILNSAILALGAFYFLYTFQNSILAVYPYRFFGF